MEIVYADFGRRLQEARLKRGFKQVEVARKVGLSPASVCNIEAGNQRVQLHVAAALAHAVDADLHALLPPMTAPPCGLTNEAWEGLTAGVRDFVRSTVSGSAGTSGAA